MISKGSVLQALNATSRLRHLLSQDEEPSECQMNVAFTRLFWDCEPLIEHPTCLIALALLRERIRNYLLERGVEGVRPPTLRRTVNRRATLHPVLIGAEHLHSALWKLLEAHHAPSARDAVVMRES